MSVDGSTSALGDNHPAPAEPSGDTQYTDSQGNPQPHPAGSAADLSVDEARQELHSLMSSDAYRSLEGAGALMTSDQKQVQARARDLQARVSLAEAEAAEREAAAKAWGGQSADQYKDLAFKPEGDPGDPGVMRATLEGTEALRTLASDLGLPATGMTKHLFDRVDELHRQSRNMSEEEREARRAQNMETLQRQYRTPEELEAAIADARSVIARHPQAKDVMAFLDESGASDDAWVISTLSLIAAAQRDGGLI